MSHSSHHRGGPPTVSPVLVVGVLIAFGLGWLGAVFVANITSARPAASAVIPPPAPPPAVAPAPPPPSAPPSAGPAPPSAGPVPVGFDEPAMTPSGLEVMSVLTKIKGGVTVTLVARDRGAHPIKVDTTSLGPHEVTFRGEPVPMEMTPQTKRLVPGEALVYSFQVKLPDMNSGELSFTVGGIPVSGQAAGD